MRGKHQTDDQPRNAVKRIRKSIERIHLASVKMSILGVKIMVQRRGSSRAETNLRLRTAATTPLTPPSSRDVSLSIFSLRRRFSPSFVARLKRDRSPWWVLALSSASLQFPFHWLPLFLRSLP